MKSESHEARPVLAGLTTLSSPGTPVHTAVPRPSSRWRTRVMLPVCVLLAFALLFAYAARGVLVPVLDVRVVPVITKAPVQTDKASTDQSPRSPVIVQAPGWIEPAPYAITVPSLVEGVVKEVLVLEGDQVKAGQVIARLIDEDFQIAVRSALADLAQHEADLVRARASVASAEAGVLVEEAAAAALLDEVTRKRELIAAGSIGAAEVRRLELQLKGLEARVAQAQSTVAESAAAVTQFEAGLESARIALAQAQLQLKRAEITSPSDGTVLARLVEPGSRVMTMSGEGAGMGGGIVRLYDPARLQVRVDVPLADAMKVGMGTKAEITTEAIPDQTFSGVVSRIVHEANIQRNTVQFKVAIAEPSPGLKPEMLCRLRLQGSAGDQGADDHKRQAGGLQMLLPSHVLIERQDEHAKVWVVEAAAGSNTRAVLREIRLGNTYGDETEILEGVRPGDRVIANPAQGLHNGARIRVVGEADNSRGSE